ncbi:Defensin-like protein [Quillaja saponaria]|uniref:Defensin-like protein n=1 Tax=Quillaja saponaria TaxID=32244 RepID=A0AAD7LPV8_QUISA|nr:Defensin-like protein [Quillaja saponaria]
MEIKKSFGLFFLLLIVVAVEERTMIQTVEAKTCNVPSGSFKGGCIGSTGSLQCARVCSRIEGLLGGGCKGVQCLCTKVC